MKNKLIAIAVAFMTAIMVGSIAAPAMASDGGVVYNQVASNGKIIAKGDGILRDVWPGRSSEWVGIWDADYFWVPGGCDAWSQWGHKYTGSSWYGPLPNTTLLSLKVIC